MPMNYANLSNDEPHSHRDDHDSDLDLDLDELDPRTGSIDEGANGHAGYGPGGTRSDRSIPLRNIRNGVRKGFRRGLARAGDDTEDVDDLEALVDKSEDRRIPGSTATSGAGDDDAPLLWQGSRKEGLAGRSPGIFDRLRSLVLPSSRTSVPVRSTEDDDEDHDPLANRTISVGQRQITKFPANAVSHAKYTPWSFLPRTLYNEFSFFFNMYFLLVALSQVIPALRIGYLSTYIVPLVAVLAITLGKEAMDDVGRRKRDNEANSEKYAVLAFDEHSGGASKQVRTKKTAGFSRKGKEKSQAASDDDDLFDQIGGKSAKKAPSITTREILKSSRDLIIGDILVMQKDRRFPADVVILKSSAAESGQTRPASTSDPSEQTAGAGQLVDTQDDQHRDAHGELVNETTSENPSAGGEAFIRTDQLDGETDWKLRLAAPVTQDLAVEEYRRLRVTGGKPDKKINEFLGTLELVASERRVYDPQPTSASSESAGGTKSQALSIDNTAWANTVLASSTTVYAVVVYTGPQTRAALSTSASRSKTGLLEYEINSLTKILCFLTLALSFILVALEGFDSKDGRPWYVAVMRFLILFSTIVPISLRVNLDMGKTVYARLIERDNGIPETVVRTSTIPEDLGRIEYLLSDKTGTLTQNEMDLKKIHVGTVSYANEAMDEVSAYIRQAFVRSSDQTAGSLFTPSTTFALAQSTGTRTRREIGLRVRDLVLALALCHNVTPTTEEIDGQTVTSYQASSPDEIAIVKWTEQVGLRLYHRDRKTITLQFAGDDRIVVRVQTLNIFPFTSDSKRMGIIVRFMPNESSSLFDHGEIFFYQKGADTVMTSIVAANDWLDEETANMAREGLRTLVIGRKALSAEQYARFTSEYTEASLHLHNRDLSMNNVVKRHLEHDLELLGVTGVEDRLQAQIKPSLELLRNAGIKIWMLTGDKVETARCVALQSKLVARGQYIHTIAQLKRKESALDALSLLHSQPNAALLIDGQSLSLYLTHHRDAFISLAVTLPAVIACRCSPTQKADIATLIRTYTGKRIACIGDGGNDVSMIQAADVGVGIVGKEGRQASLAADFSITQFAHLTKLLVWHGRNSYKRSAKLAQFVIHRGLIISVCQTVFSIASHFEPIALYRDWLLVGYATVYTMAPVFSLVLDRDVDEGLANLYPELYKELTTGRSLSYRTFFIWVAISIYQGCIIQGASQLLVPGFYTAIPTGDAGGAGSDPGTTTKTADTGGPGFQRMVAVSYTVLILNELIMVAAEITTWHPVMIFSILGTASLYFGSIPFLKGYFDLPYVITGGFWWRVAAISAVSLVPVYAGKLIRRRIKPPSYRKVRGV